MSASCELFVQLKLHFCATLHCTWANLPVCVLSTPAVLPGSHLPCSKDAVLALVHM